MKRSALWGGGCAFCTCASIVLMIVLLALTVNREVSQSEYVVQYNEYDCTFGKILTQGRYTTEVGVTFKEFPRVLEDLKVKEVTCLSSDKVEIKLGVKIQYRLRKDELIDVILKQFGTIQRHVKFLKRMATSSLLFSCLDYTAEEFYSSRSEVDLHMFDNLQKDINEFKFAADIEFFQLNDITLPDDLIDVITEKQGIAQQIITATNERENAIITAETNYLSVEQSSQVILIEANNTASIILNLAYETENAIMTEWYNRAVAYSGVTTSMGLTEDQFLEYLEAELFRLANKTVTE